MTVTLPERTLRDLATLHSDRARAIVAATESAVRSGGKDAPAVEVIEVAPDTAVILLGAIPSLKKIPWLKLIRIGPNRHLLTIVPGTSVESVEVAILDAIDDLPASARAERATLTTLLMQVRRRRRDREITKAEILFVRPDRMRGRE